MKNQVFNLKSLFLSSLLIIGLSFSLTAQDKEVKKDMTENFKVTKDFTLGIDNKFGSIDIVNWDKNELEVKVVMIVKAKSEDKAQKILDKIDIQVSEGSNGVDFNTIMDFKNLDDKISVEVKYTVNAPASLNVGLSQKFGSIFIEEISGDAEIDLSYGELKVKSLVNASGGLNQLVMAYSDAKLGVCSKLNGKLAYSDIHFGEVESWEGKLAYSDITAEVLTGAIHSDLAYSDLVIEKLAAGFTAVDVGAAYSDVVINADQAASYSYTLESKFGEINAPEGAKRVGEKKEIDPSNHTVLEGSVGSSPSGKVTVNSKFGDLKLK